MSLTLLALAACLLLVLANAFFVASEFALVKMRATRLVELAEAGSRRARTALGISQRIDAYLSANQLGITLASLALGWLGKTAFANLVRPLFAHLGPRAAAAGETVSLIAGFVVITFLHTVLGELAPKSLAIQRTEPVALRTARPLHAFYVVAYPVIWLLNAASALTLRLLRLRPPSEVGLLHTPEEIRLVLRQVAIDPGARRLIDRVFDYTRRVARHVMTLRRDVIVLEAGRDFDESVARALEHQYTRYPLVNPEGDRVLGFVHLKDLMAALVEGTRPRLRDIVRRPVYATEATPLEGIRRAFQRQRVHLAVIRGPRSEFVGIVTLEDLLEEFVGEILDEQDTGEVPPIVRGEGGRFEVDGRITLDVVRRELGFKLTDAPGVETVGGYLAARLGQVPVVGDAIEAAGFRLTVIEASDRRARRIAGVPLGSTVARAPPGG